MTRDGPEHSNCSPPTVHRPPFGANDTTAFGVLNAATALGLSVADDLWVVGYDDVAMAAWERIDLTTIPRANSGWWGLEIRRD